MRIMVNTVFSNVTRAKDIAWWSTTALFQLQKLIKFYRYKRLPVVSKDDSPSNARSFSISMLEKYGNVFFLCTWRN